jgi:hypothetical protein
MTEKTDKKAGNDPADRLEKFFGQIAEIDAKNRKAAYEAIEEYAKLMKASIDYAGKINDEWRRIALETSRRTADVMTAWV